MLTERDLLSHFPQRVERRDPLKDTTPCGHREMHIDGQSWRECRRVAGHNGEHDFGFWQYQPKESA